MQHQIENIGDFLKKRGIKPSYQRLKILEYLLQSHEHPSVDMIYRELVTTIPTLSRTTVYNTLDLFHQEKIVSVIVIEENETRYDGNTSIHGHFKCHRCERIYDLLIDPAKIDIPQLTSHQVDEHHFYFKGTCRNCLDKGKDK